MSRRGDKIMVTAWVDEATFRALEDAHWEARLTRAEWLREAIREKLARDRGDAGA